MVICVVVMRLCGEEDLGRGVAFVDDNWEGGPTVIRYLLTREATDCNVKTLICQQDFTVHKVS